MVAIELVIPDELRNRIPLGLLTAAKLRLPVSLFSLCLACLALSAFENRNWWTYLAGAVVSPFLTAIYFSVFPLNPYRTPAAKFSGMFDKDKEDQACKRFADLMRSRSAHRVLLAHALKLSLILLLAMAAISKLQSKPIGWALDRDSAAWFLLLTLLSSLVLVPIFINILVVWSLKNWSGQQPQRGINGPA